MGWVRLGSEFYDEEFVLYAKVSIDFSSRELDALTSLTTDCKSNAVLLIMNTFVVNFTSNKLLYSQ